MAEISEALASALEAAVGAAGLRRDPEDLRFYGSDRCRGDWSVDPAIIVLPKTVEQVQAVVRACVAHGAAIVPSGGRTGLAGAATATRGEVVVSVERMNRVLDIDEADRTIRCEPGVTIEGLQAAAAERGLLFPVDYAAKGTAQIGGGIATNAGGVKVLRYGTMRNWVAGLRAVVASGEVVDIGGSLVKDNTGYDLRQLFIGSEGTLGVVVEATMRVCTPPRGEVQALCALPDDPSVLRLFSRIQRALPLMAFECFDQGCFARVLEHRCSEGRGPFAEPSPQHVLLEVEVQGHGHGEAAHERTVDALTEVLADAQEAGEIVDAKVAGTPAQGRDLWAWREDISESLHRHRPHKADVALPVAKVIEFLTRWRALVGTHLPEAEALVFGHVGDGNLHLNILQPPQWPHESFLAKAKAFDEHTYALVESFGGSVSAEHGIGLLKRAHLHHSRSEGEISMMRAIKKALDPRGVFNPGKVF